MSHLFSHIMVRAEHDIPNWILYESGRFTLKSARTFFLNLEVTCGWGKFIWFSYLSPSKTLVLWKVFHGRIPTDKHIQNKGLYICSMCTLCEKHEESTQHLFLNVLMFCVFGVGFDRFFLLLISLIRMIFSLLLRVMIVLWLN